MDEFDFDYMNFLNGFNSKSNSINNYSNDNISSKVIDPSVGFSRGNLFNNLYDQYKNYKPVMINPQSEKDALLNQWQQYNFAVVELNLYLDTYPNDVNALKLLNNYNNILKQITKKYESLYGPICITDVGGASNYDWLNGDWPWEVSR